MAATSTMKGIQLAAFAIANLAVSQIAAESPQHDASGVQLMRSETARTGKDHVHGGSALERGHYPYEDVVDLHREHAHHMAGMNATSSLADIQDANHFCGGSELMYDCGFQELLPVCTDASNKECFRGMCVCTAEMGCREPQCEAKEGPCESHGLAPCSGADGRCLVRAGNGWQCWHPCNMEHSSEHFGSDHSGIVEDLRSSGACARFQQPTRVGGVRLRGRGRVRAGLQRVHVDVQRGAGGGLHTEVGEHTRSHERCDR